MKSALRQLIAAALLTLGVSVSGCTTVQIKQTLKEYRLIVKPGNVARPRSYQRGDGETDYEESIPTEGNTLMIVVRGKL